MSDSPIGRFVPSREEIRTVQNEQRISLHDARKMLIRQNLQRALAEATTFDELKLILAALISCAQI